MDTPIVDFVRSYCESGTMRLHMPGHKGVKLLGMEDMDLTEIRGADSLYEAEGIISRSEGNASNLYGCPTYYSTEGSSQCIRAMLFLAMQYKCGSRRPLRVLAGRNAHRTFLSACALLDIQVRWLMPGDQISYLSCPVTGRDVAAAMKEDLPDAVYLTSPDYLGNSVDIASVAEVCHENGVLLLVDNAHGAYLRFLQTSRHPMDLGADLCCDSVHKTLPGLTGAAYLHTTGDFVCGDVRNALAMFGSTSPSYLILQSLDAVNGYLADGYTEKLNCFTELVTCFKVKISDLGWQLCGDEPMKITLATKGMGYTGGEVADFLRKSKLECEFSDPDYVVCMVTPQTGDAGLSALYAALAAIPGREPILEAAPGYACCESVLSVRKAAFSAAEVIPAQESVGRILAAASVGCPPAVPIVICGERINAHAVDCFRYYGITTCTVVKE